MLKLVGGQYHIHDAVNNRELALAVQKGFKLKEDIRISINGVEKFGIFARKVIDFSGVYDVVDLETQPNTVLAVFKRKGWKSAFVRDEWIVCDAQEREVGTMIEDSVALGLIRRFLTNIIPQNYDFLVGGSRVVDLRQNFNPFNYNLNVIYEIAPDRMDRRIAIAGAVLLAAIEGRQRN
ncbi:MAG: hypothetical protein JST40_13935 [Armatimonadetes bacterium]|nr:hypothetical protein [Armatimonadota bacterium]